MDALKIGKIVHIIFYISSTLALLAILLTDININIYFKPFIVLTLGALYVIKTKSPNILVIVGLFFSLLSEFMANVDFVNFFHYAATSLAIYFLINNVLLFKIIKEASIDFKKIFTIPFFISAIFILYLLGSIVEMIILEINGMRYYMYILILIGLVYIAFCYIIYTNNKNNITLLLILSTISYIVVTALTPVHELFLHMTIYELITNFFMISGQYLMVRFYYKTDQKAPSDTFI